MLTRAQSKQSKQELDVTIDFDEASKAWLANKVRVGPGCYRYTCVAITKTGHSCKRVAIQGQDCCPIHTQK